MNNTYEIIIKGNLIDDITIKYFMIALMYILSAYYQHVKQKINKNSEKKEIEYHLMMETKKNIKMTKVQFNARYIQKTNIKLLSKS